MSREVNPTVPTAPSLEEIAEEYARLKYKCFSEVRDSNTLHAIKDFKAGYAKCQAHALAKQEERERGLIEALEKMLKKNPNAVGINEAADMAVEFHMGMHSALCGYKAALAEAKLGKGGGVDVPGV